jgi:hypothetical protein
VIHGVPNGAMERRSYGGISDMAALFATKVNQTGAPEISPVERLLNEFEAHEAKEEKSLEQYRELLARMPNPVARFLLQLIISDEEKHRAVIHAMIATLKGSLTWTKPQGSLEAPADLADTHGQLRVSNRCIHRA